MNRKFLSKFFRFIFLVSFVSFLVIYFTHSVGYLEYKNKRQAALTSRQIKEFERDVALGKNVDAQKYLKTVTTDYQNGISRFGLKISKVTGSGIKMIVGESFKFLSKFNE